MEPLDTNRKLFTWLCIYPIANQYEKFVKIIFCSIMILIVITVFVSGIFFVCKHLSIDMASTLFALVQIIGSIDLFYTLIISYIFSESIVEIFVDLCGIFEKCETSIINNKYVIGSASNKYL